MKFKLILALLVSILVFGSSVVAAQSMTDAQKQALIAQIKQEIALLTQQLQQMLAQQGNSGPWCYTFNNDLGFVNSGNVDVINLHLALQREGISYNPDDMSTYSNGTSQGVISFQSKYKISPQTGYVGPKTRAKLNQLYSCPTPVQTVCKPNWSCTNWSLCLGQQTRTCSDLNNCGVTTGEPVMSQTCTEKPVVDLQANNSQGPVNIFLTLGNGATVTNSGISLTTSVNLKWGGVEVLSCSASDSENIFSGYEPSNGYATVVMSGTIKAATGSASKVSDTFKISCVSTTSGSQVSDSVTVNLYYTVSNNCYPNWQCTDWTACTKSPQTRACTDYNGCGSTVGQPIQSQTCVVPPTVNIKANNSDGTITVAGGSSVNLSWTSTGATSCIASGDWAGAEVLNGKQSITMNAASKTFNITCTNTGGSATDSVTVNTAD